MMGVLQEILHLIVEFAILIFEYIGVGVILCAGIRGILNSVSYTHLTLPTKLEV